MARRVLILGALVLMAPMVYFFGPDYFQDAKKSGDQMLESYVASNQKTSSDQAVKAMDQEMMQLRKVAKKNRPAVATKTAKSKPKKRKKVRYSNPIQKKSNFRVIKKQAKKSAEHKTTILKDIIEDRPKVLVKKKPSKKIDVMAGRWENLGAPDGKLAMKNKSKDEDICNYEGCVTNDDHGISVVGIVLETDELNKKDSVVFDGDIESGSYRDATPAVYVK